MLTFVGRGASSSLVLSPTQGSARENTKTLLVFRTSRVTSVKAKKPFRKLFSTRKKVGLASDKSFSAT